MAWVLFLPSGQRRTAAIEIFPAGLVNHIYKTLSLTLGVRYEQVRASHLISSYHPLHPIASHCTTTDPVGPDSRLLPSLCVLALRVQVGAHAAAGCKMGSSMVAKLMCNVTVQVDTVVAAAARAAVWTAESKG
jgi:hypothetical protein